jgi:hypothetical protein
MRTSTWLLLIALGAGAGCYHHEYAAEHPAYYHPAVGWVSIPPPAPIVEAPPPQPYVGAVWMAGFWQWRPSLGRYEWVQGHWGTPPELGVVYQPPTWIHGRYGFYQEPGRWIIRGERDVFGRRYYLDAAGQRHYF